MECVWGLHMYAHVRMWCGVGSCGDCGGGGWVVARVCVRVSRVRCASMSTWYVLVCVRVCSRD